LDVRIHEINARMSSRNILQINMILKLLDGTGFVLKSSYAPIRDQIIRRALALNNECSYNATHDLRFQTKFWTGANDLRVNA
jgi:hypothetical protein